MRRAWAAIAAAAALLLLAGCLGDTPGASEPAADAATGGETNGTEATVQRDQARFTHEASEGASAEWTPRENWAVDAPGTLLGAAAEITTGDGPADWRLAVTAPDGETTYLDPGPTEDAADANLTDPEAGTYELELQARGPRTPETVEAGFEYTWRGAADAGGARDAPDVTFERTSDGQWRATITYETAADPADVLDVRAETFNGRAELATGGDRTEAAVAAYGEADSKDRARALAEDVDVTLEASSDQVTATASSGMEQTRDDESQGANVAVETPARVSGTASTNNGAIDLVDLVAGALEATTNNGRVSGTIADAAGDLALRTDNGAVEVEVTPTTSLTLEAGTDNGRIDLGLAEGPGIGYELDSSVDNGRMSEDMEEASFEDRQDRTTGSQATLRTDGYDDRENKVSGTVGTGNGRLHYQGR